MTRFLAISSALIVLLAGLAHAEQAVSCKGSITSKQGEGMVVKTFRFDVAEVTGRDIKEVLENCRKVAQQRQNKAGRANPAVGFRKFSDLDLECTQGAEKFPLRRALQTAP